MASLAALRQMQAELEAKEQQIKALQSDPRVKADLAFEHDVIEVLNKHGRSLADAVQLIAPELLKKQRQPRERGPDGEPVKRPYTRKAEPNGQPTQPLMLYKNPHTGEEVKARNILRNPLPEWCAKWGKDTVKTWKTPVH